MLPLFEGKYELKLFLFLLYYIVIGMQLEIVLGDSYLILLYFYRFVNRKSSGFSRGASIYRGVTR